MRPLLWRTLSLAALAGPAFVGTANAQEQQEPDRGSVAEITVFAQKREQRLQDVPLTVSAFNEQTLQDAGVNDIKELTILTPGLLVTSTSNETVTTARIRGVGTVGDNPGLESSVGVVIDGVYRPRNGVGFGDLGEIERIEVLKGPQGTLFGKNTSAGVIQVFTKRPEFDFGADAELTIGEFGTLGYSAAVTGPLVEDKVAVRLYGAQRERDGFLDVRTAGGTRTETDDNNQDFYTLRGQLLFEPTANISINLIADISERDEYCCAAVTIPSTNPTATANATAGPINAILQARTGLANAALDTSLDPFARIAFSDRPTDQRVEDKGFSAEASWDLGGAEVVYVGAYRTWDLESAQDSDFSAADILYRPDDGTNGTEFETLSQEVRLQGRLENILSGLDWVIGGYYAQEDLQLDSTLLYGEDFRAYQPVLGGAAGGAALTAFVAANPTIFVEGTGIRDRYTQEDTSWAIFTQQSLALTDRLEATIGLRYTDTSKDLRTDYNTTGASCNASLSQGLAALAAATCITFMNENFDALGITNQSLSENEVTGTGKIAFDFTDDILGFVSYSRGYKAGGFNLDRENTPAGTPDTNTSFAPEIVDAWEVGLKTSWANGTVRANFSIFNNEFKDFQLNTFLGTTFVVASIPEVTSTGAEMDLAWETPVDGLALNLGASVSETEYGNFPLDPVGGRGSALLPGNTLSFAPDYSISGGGVYEKTLWDKMLVRTALNGRYVDDYNTGSDLLPAKEQEAFFLLNGRITFASTDERYSLEFWGENLTDTEYVQVAFNGTLQGSVTSSTAPALTVGGNPVYNPANDTVTYKAFLGAPRVLGATFRVKY